MKKILIMIVGLFLSACASTTTQSSATDPYEHITVENVKENCQPAESWNVSVLGRPAIVLRFDDCLDVKMLLIVATGEVTEIEKIRRMSMELLSLHYGEYLKRTNPDGIYTIVKIKENSSEGWLTYYYSIIHKNPTCTKDSCKKED